MLRFFPIEKILGVEALLLFWETPYKKRKEKGEKKRKHRLSVSNTGLTRKESDCLIFWHKAVLKCVQGTDAEIHSLSSCVALARERKCGTALQTPPGNLMPVWTFFPFSTPPPILVASCSGSGLQSSSRAAFHMSQWQQLLSFERETEQQAGSCQPWIPAKGCGGRVQIMKSEASHRHQQGRKKAPGQCSGCSHEKGYQWSPRWAGRLNGFGNSRRNLNQVHSFSEIQATSCKSWVQAYMAWRERVEMFIDEESFEARVPLF